jgi:hypothetical protein
MTRDTKKSITSDKLREVVALHKANLAAIMPKPAGAPVLARRPVKPAELDQEAGGGYNATGTFPQQ